MKPDKTNKTRVFECPVCRTRIGLEAYKLLDQMDHCEKCDLPLYEYNFKFVRG